MTHDEIVAQAWSTLLEFVDKATSDGKIDLTETAQIYRELASECRDRATGLDEEADAEAHADDGDDHDEEEDTP